MSEHTIGLIQASHNTGTTMQSYQQSSVLHGTGEGRLKLIAGCFKDIGGEMVAAANARRLAACWNAFDGCTTFQVEELLNGELGGFKAFAADKYGRIESMKKENDAYRAMLHKVYEFLELKGKPNPPEYYGFNRPEELIWLSGYIAAVDNLRPMIKDTK